MRIANLLSIDVEDYFQVSAFEKVSPPDTWNRWELRVERNTQKVLDLLEEFSVKGTFFILGWVADRCPDLVKRIAAEGHEVASHGYSHQRVPNQTRAEFRDDVRRSKAILEELTGREVIGYRAPSYSISRETFWAFDELHEAGYRYDSSIFPIRHDFYGIPEWPRFAGYAVKTPGGSWKAAAAVEGQAAALYEVPITTLRFAGRNLPVAGGGYFRLFPYAFTRWGLCRINKRENKPFVFYLHPWELDPDQPRMRGISAKSKFRHYLNLNKTGERFRQLLRDYDFVPISEALLPDNESADYL